MPFITIRGFRFGVFTHEPEYEPMHVHVKGKGAKAKFWLRPVRLKGSTYNRSVAREIERIVRRHETTFVRMWERIHGDD